MIAWTGTLLHSNRSGTALASRVAGTIYPADLGLDPGGLIVVGGTFFVNLISLTGTSPQITVELRFRNTDPAGNSLNIARDNITFPAQTAAGWKRMTFDPATVGGSDSVASDRFCVPFDNLAIAETMGGTQVDSYELYVRAFMLLEQDNTRSRAHTNILLTPDA